MQDKFCPRTVWPDLQPECNCMAGDKYHQASKYILKGPESASIEIPSFRPQFIKFSKTVFYEVNFVTQCSHLEILLLSNLGFESGDFN